VLNRVIMKAWRGSAPAQINMPRDYWTQVIDIELPQMVRFERPPAARQAIAQAAALLSNAKFPVILSTAPAWCSAAPSRIWQAGRTADAPVCSNYQHNDAFPRLASRCSSARWATTAPRPRWS
jgi:sulfoacetaldehyde acetyltransferase